MRRIIAVVFMTATMLVMSVAPVLAQNNDQDGLVNIFVTDINANVQVPIGVAANVCNVDANVVAQQFDGSDDAVCTARNNQLPRAFQQ